MRQIRLIPFAVLLAAAAIGPVRGALAQVLYVGIAMVGVPVMAGQSAGVTVVFGATGGHLLGFIRPRLWLATWPSVAGAASRSK